MKTLEQLVAENEILEEAHKNLLLRNEVLNLGGEIQMFLESPKPSPCETTTHFRGKPVAYWVELEKAAMEARNYLGGTDCRVADRHHGYGMKGLITLRRLEDALGYQGYKAVP